MSCPRCGSLDWCARALKAETELREVKERRDDALNDYRDANNERHQLRNVFERIASYDCYDYSSCLKLYPNDENEWCTPCLARATLNKKYNE